MKKVGNHNSISRKLYFSLALMLIFSLSSFAQDAAPAAATGGDPAKGKELFNANCAACHKLDAKATGPALRGIAGKYEMSWIYKWVHNSSDLIKSGDAAAVKVFEENNKSVMTSFPQLSTGDIDNIIAYTSEPKAEAPAATAGTAAAGTGDARVAGENEFTLRAHPVLGALDRGHPVLFIDLGLALHDHGPGLRSHRPEIDAIDIPMRKPCPDGLHLTGIFPLSRRQCHSAGNNHAWQIMLRSQSHHHGRQPAAHPVTTGPRRGRTGGRP